MLYFANQINNWENERPPDFVHFGESSSAVDNGSDYFTIGVSEVKNDRIKQSNNIKN